MIDTNNLLNKHKGLLFAFVLIILVQVFLGFFAFNQFDNWADRGTFGDMFGAINTLFSGLAFCGVIYAIFLQSKELEFQRKELELQRKALEDTAESQKQQAALALLAAKINAISAKLDTYKSLNAAGVRVPGTSEYAYDLMAKSMNQLDALIEKDA